MSSAGLRVEPLTPARWHDFRALFGDRGAFGGCWCMWWRQTRREFDECHGAENERHMRAIVESGNIPGLIAYDGDLPVAWVSVGPRADYPSLNRSPNLKPVDATPSWAITCFFIAEGHRGRGVMSHLIDAACAFAREGGAMAVEAFPVEPGPSDGAALPAALSGAFMGVPAPFSRAGFVEVARRGRRTVLRRVLGT